MNTIMVTINEGHEHDFGYRPTSTGLALHHCTLGGSTDVLEGQVISLFNENHRVRLDMLEGETRYRAAWAPGLELVELEHEAGPYHLDIKDGYTTLTCECGWVGKRRHSSALRFLIGDQVTHRCPR